MRCFTWNFSYSFLCYFSLWIFRFNIFFCKFSSIFFGSLKKWNEKNRIDALLTVVERELNFVFGCNWKKISSWRGDIFDLFSEIFHWKWGHFPLKSQNKKKRNKNGTNIISHPLLLLVECALMYRKYVGALIFCKIVSRVVKALLILKIGGSFFL